MNQYDSYSPWSEALGVYKKHALVIIGTALMLHIVEIAITFLALNAWGVKGLYLVVPLDLMIAQLTIGVYTSLMLHLRAGNDAPTIDRLIGGILPMAPKLLWLSLVIGFGIAIGYMILIVPGILISVRWAVATPAMVATNVSTGDALSASTRLTEGRRGQTWWIMFMMGLLTIGATRITRAAFPDAAPENLIIIQALVSSFVAPLCALAIASWYMHLAGYAPLDSPQAAAAPGNQPWGTAAAAPPGVWVPSVPVPAAASAQPQPAYAYGAPASAGYVAQSAQPYAGHAAQAYPSQPTHAYPEQPAAGYPGQPGAQYAQPVAPAAPPAPVRERSVAPPGM